MPDVPPSDPADYNFFEDVYNTFNDVSDFLYGTEPDEYIAPPQWVADEAADWGTDWVGDEGADWYPDY